MNIKRFINIHTILLLVFLLMIGGIAYRFTHWGIKINLEEIFQEDPEVKPDTFDLFLPVMNEDGTPVTPTREIKNIICFGNAPFADDRDSEDNLANMIAKKTGATVYNCSISGSFLAAEYYTISTSLYPRDAYNLYWLMQVACKTKVYKRGAKAAQELGDKTPPEAEYVYDTLWNMDFNQIDAIIIMYDGSDYLAGHAMYNDDNPTDIECFTGNLEASIELIQSNFPWIRIIVMSPTYAFAVNEKGEYISSDKYTYGWDVLSTYVIKEYGSCFDRSVTFVDHLYGTINEDNAKDYLIDNIHLNKAGRELVADRCVQAINY